MNTVIAFLVKSIISGGILFSYYLIALRNKEFNQYNRFYLLSVLIASVVIPFLNFRLYIAEQPALKHLNDLSYNIISNHTIQHPKTFFIPEFLYCSISLVIFFILLIKVIWIYKMRTSHVRTRMNGYTLIETELKQAPFSFLNNLFWRKDISMHDDNGRKIFIHELTHITEKHTYDKLLAQIMLSIFWINPFYWLIQKELDVIHEFIADSKSIKAGDAESFAEMLLHSHNEGRYLEPSHSFFYSSIKRRLVMITSQKNTRCSWLTRVLALPIFILVLVLFSFITLKAQNDPRLSPGPVNVQKVMINKLNDSIAGVQISYLDANSNPAVLNMSAKYSNNDSIKVGDEKKAIIYDEESGTKREATAEEVRNVVSQIIQDPPGDMIYFVDGKEYSKESIKKLDPNIVKTINIFSHEEAVKKYGERARNGVVVLTTK